MYRLSINAWGNYIEIKKVYKYKIDSISIPLSDSQKVILWFNCSKFVVVHRVFSCGGRRDEDLNSHSTAKYC